MALDDDAHLMRELDRVSKAVDKLGDKIDNVSKDHVSQVVFELNRTEQGRRIGELEAANRWAMRLAVGGIISGVGLNALQLLVNSPKP